MTHPTDEMFSVDVPAVLAEKYERNPFFMCQKCWNHVMGMAVMQVLR